VVTNSPRNLKTNKKINIMKKYDYIFAEELDAYETIQEARDEAKNALMHSSNGSQVYIVEIKEVMTVNKVIKTTKIK